MKHLMSGLLFATLLSAHAVAAAADRVEHALMQTEQTLANSLVRGDSAPFDTAWQATSSSWPRMARPRIAPDSSPT